MLEVVVEHEVSIAQDLAVNAENESCSVKVEVIAAVILLDIPAQTDEDSGKSGIILREVNLLSFEQTNHDCLLYIDAEVLA